jgi:uncharacterized protein YxeA
MKKFIIIIVAVLIIVPVAAHAFSFSDVINFGNHFFHHEAQKAQLEPAAISQETAAPKPKVETFDAETKFNNWQKALNDNNVSAVFADKRNLYFTDSEINYLIAGELADETNPVAHNVTVLFSNNLAKVSGSVSLKNLSGQFYLEAKPVITDNKISFQVTKAKYHNFYFPAVLAQTILSSQLKDAINFLYSDQNYQNITLEVGNGFVQLNTN